MSKATDSDGNVIEKGMAVVSGGDRWVVGYADPRMVRLDRIVRDRVKECRLVGRRRFSCVHILGWEVPLVVK
jgi:hypothetical protein